MIYDYSIVQRLQILGQSIHNNNNYYLCRVGLPHSLRVVGFSTMAGEKVWFKTMYFFFPLTYA